MRCRDPKEVDEEEYKQFYKAIAKDPSAEALGWAHFKVCLSVLYMELSLMKTGRYRFRGILPLHHVHSCRAPKGFLAQDVERIE
jgi:hypothetical protein